MSDDPRALMDVFRQEAEEVLSALSRHLLELESSEAGEARNAKVREIFRLAHSLKGAAATVGLQEITRIAHALESCLDRLRRGTLEPDRALIDAALSTVDGLQASLSRALTPEEANVLCQRLEGIVAAAAAVPAAPVEVPAEPPRRRPRRRKDAGPKLEALLPDLLVQVAKASQGEPLAPLLHTVDAIQIASAEKPNADRVARRMARTLGALAEAGDRPSGELVQALMMAADVLQSELGQGASSMEVDLTLEALGRAHPPTRATEAAVPPEPAKSSRPPSGRPAAPASSAPTQAPKPVPPSAPHQPPAATPASAPSKAPRGPDLAQPSEAYVRMPVTLLDSILFRLDELVAVKLRMEFQRRQIEEVQLLLDTQHTMARQGSGARVVESESVSRRLEHIRGGLTQDLHAFNVLAQALQEDVKEVRMVPVGPVLDPFRRLVRDTAQQLGKEAVLEIRGEEVRVDKTLFELLRDPLTHLLRNAVDHGIELPEERRAADKPPRGHVTVTVDARDSQVWLEIKDDGRGIQVSRVREAAVEKGIIDRERVNELTDREAMNLIFLPGFSTASEVTEISGRGVGLDVVRENVAKLGGKIEFFSDAGRGSQFILSVPLMLSASRGLIVGAGRQLYCVPLIAVEEVVVVSPEDVGIVQGHLAIRRRRQTTPFAMLEDVLAARPSARPNRASFAVVIALSDRRLAIGVDELLGQEEVVVKSLAAGTPKLPFVAGATGLSDGRLVTVLDPGALFSSGRLEVRHQASNLTPARVLVVDDSLTTRAMVASVLERAGYQATVATDGERALELLRREEVDLVVSDVEMPGMDGLSLVRHMRNDQRLAGIPLILVTSLDDAADRARGAEAGATAYIVKRDFDPGAFLGLVGDCLSKVEQDS